MATLLRETTAGAAQGESVRETLAAVRDKTALLPIAKETLARERQALRQDFEAGLPATDLVRRQADLIDDLVCGLLDQADQWRFHHSNPTAGERLVVLAVGGYGRAELAPGSDIDLLVLYPYKRTPRTEQLVEALLYSLWDLGLKVGHATRSLEECVRAARDDVSICTSVLENRLVWGDAAIAGTFRERLREEVVQGREASFIEAKLAERDERHRRTGDSRYLLEPNVKEGKGGLRDIQNLMWLGHFLYDIRSVDELVTHGVLDAGTKRQFVRAHNFLTAVRCHLHYETGRAEERLTFDLQPVIAERLGFAGRRRQRPVERFMKRYYMVAKEVGGLTRVVCAALEQQFQRTSRFQLPTFGFGQRRMDGMRISAGRVGFVGPEQLRNDPISILKLFHLAEQRGLDIEPTAVRDVQRNLAKIDLDLREDPEAIRLFLEMLTSDKTPGRVLTRLNEAGVLGKFVPEFGRIVAQMQHDLYHVYTVDEHTIRAIRVVRAIEQGELADELPMATSLMPNVVSRDALFLALFFHDLGKGRGGDHSVIGEQIVRTVGERWRLPGEEIETVAWLVRHHLLMSATAFSRDLEDPKTVQDFVEVVQSPERLRLLLILTVCDIRAVGPNVWNGWKGQLLRSLYNASEALMITGDVNAMRRHSVGRAKSALREALLASDAIQWSDEEIETYLERHDLRYWMGFSEAAHLRHAKLVHDVESKGEPLGLGFQMDTFRARTEFLVFTPDHPGLFMKLAGALALSGVSIVDAHIFTTQDGMAMDSLGIQNAENLSAVTDPRQLQRIRKNVEEALAGKLWLDKAQEGRTSLPSRAAVFQVTPRVLLDNKASRTHTVIEVNGRDRPGLLYEFAKALKELGLVISSAHITTFGERVVDVVYVKDVFGMKLTRPSKVKQVKTALLEVLATDSEQAA
ncbi:MAG: [protein-PII] uridylyltransferase [Geminicoccaceae bacterium]